jgi:cytochrome P450
MICDIAGDLGDGVTWTSGIVGNPPFIYVGADPAIIEHVLKSAFWKYEKGEWFRHTVEVLLGHGIFNSDGAVWQKQRKVASHMFTARSLREEMSGIFAKNAHVVMEKLAQNARDKKIFDVQDLFFRFTLDSFSEVAFGESGPCACTQVGWERIM